MPSPLAPDELPPGSPPPPVNLQQEGAGDRAELPRLPRSRPRRPTSAEGPPPSPSPPPSPLVEGASSATSSPSEDKPDKVPKPPKPEREKAAPEDVAAALAEGTDKALELLMVSAGYLHRKLATNKPGEQAWRPTEKERADIVNPTTRIFRRHTPNADLIDADAIDAALIGAGLLTIAARSVTEAKTKEQNGTDQASS